MTTTLTPSATLATPKSPVDKTDTRFTTGIVTLVETGDPGATPYAILPVIDCSRLSGFILTMKNNGSGFINPQFLALDSPDETWKNEDDTIIAAALSSAQVQNNTGSAIAAGASKFFCSVGTFVALPKFLLVVVDAVAELVSTEAEFIGTYVK